MHAIADLCMHGDTQRRHIEEREIGLHSSWRIGTRKPLGRQTNVDDTADDERMTDVSSRECHVSRRKSNIQTELVKAFVNGKEAD
jgi:hypothetical protein